MPLISGHAPGHLREEFWEIADDPDCWGSPAFWKITGWLWNCRDIMPSGEREDLRENLRMGAWDDSVQRIFTYGQACRAMRRIQRPHP